MLNRLSLINLGALQMGGSHFGHKARDWKPKVIGHNNFLLKDGNFLVFNLKNSIYFFQKSYMLFKQMSYKGGVGLYVDSGRKSIRGAVKDAALFAGIPFIINLWAGGTLTNFREVVYKVIRNANKIIRPHSKKTLRYVSGLYALDFVPEIILVSGEFHSPFAVSEANNLLIPSIAIADSNLNSLESTYSIPMNDDSFLSTRVVFFIFSSSYWFGKADFAMRYLKITNLVMDAFAPVWVNTLKKHSVEHWLKDLKKKYLSSFILKLITVAGLEPTFSVTRSGF